MNYLLNLLNFIKHVSHVVAELVLYIGILAEVWLLGNVDSKKDS